MRLPSLKVTHILARYRQVHVRFKKQVGFSLLVALWLVLWAALSGCAAGGAVSDAEERELIIFAAASLTETFGEAARQFELANPGVTVVLNLAGSQQLAHQLSQGAPADIFASADAKQMESAIKAGRVKAGSEQSFAGNQLALIFPAANPAGLRTLSDLARPGLKLVLATPEVPAGRYARLLLEAAGDDPAFGPIFRAGVLGNIVSYEENVRAVLSKIRLGEADAGIVYASDITPQPEDVGQLPIPDYLNIQAEYPIAPLVDSQQPDLARLFIAYMLGNQGQALLQENGLTPVVGE